MTPNRIDELIGVYRDGLLEDTLKFWFPGCVDEEYGGYLIARDRDGSLLDDDKGTWQQCRTAWMLGELYNRLEPRAEWLEWCRSGIEFIDKHCLDQSDGRMWFHLTRDGRPVRKRRYAFSESFAAIAYGEYARATDSGEYAQKARGAFDSFIEHNLNNQQPKFTDERPSKSIGFPMILIATCQELRGSIGLDSADGWIDQSIRTIREDYMKHDIECVMETVAPHGGIIDHFDGRTLNPGHAIEAAWFVMREGMLREDRDLVDTGRTMLDWMWKRGWDEEHGGILYFRDLNDGPVQEYWHDMKFWWPQNEAIIASLLAYRLTGDEKYEQMHARIHDWAYSRFPDPEHGEWFGYLHRDGTVSIPLKGNVWKGPFHLPRMQLTCWRILEGIGSQDTV